MFAAENQKAPVIQIDWAAARRKAKATRDEIREQAEGFNALVGSLVHKIRFWQCASGVLLIIAILIGVSK
jgi:hypothetical protein